MAKLTLTDLANLQNGTTAANAINSNNTLIEDAIENTLSRDGSSPNRMGAALDMDSNAILNLPAPTSLTEPVRLQDLEDLIEGSITINGAPTSASYVTLTNDGTLTNERLLTAGLGISVTDAGAGSLVTVAVTGRLPASIGVGVAADPTIAINAVSSITGAANAAGMTLSPTFTSPGGTLGDVYGINLAPSMDAGSTTATYFIGERIWNIVKGSGNTVTHCIGLWLNAQTVGATTNLSMYSDGAIEINGPVLLDSTSTVITKSAIASTSPSGNNFTSVTAPDGNECLSLGSTAPENIYSNTFHVFRSRDGLTDYFNMQATGVSSGLPMAILTGTSIPAGGTAGSGYRFSSTANFGIFFGSGAPSLAAAKGSLYLRSNGSGTTDRAYINTDGSTTWTALTTAA